MAPFHGVPTPEQQVALAIAPKVSALLSIAGSSYIILDAVKRLRRKTSTNHTYHRLLIGLSACDLSMSIGLFTSTWFMPSNTPYVWGAIGTIETCEAIGFLEQAGVAAVLYNASLSTYYLLRIRYQWSPTQLVRAEYGLHFIPIAFGLSTMIACLALDLYNSGIFDCWIAPFPQGCEESWRSPTGETTCVRGNNASLYQWVFDVIPKWLSVLIVTLFMFLTHRGVYVQECKTLQYRDPSRCMERWSMPVPGSDSSFRKRGSSNRFTMGDEDPTESKESPHSNEGSPPNLESQVFAPPPRFNSKKALSKMKLPMSRRLARQSYLYVGALYLTYIPVIVTRATELALGYVYYEMLLTIAIMIPLQGFWNVLVYLRPRYLRERERQIKMKKLSELRERHERGEGDAPDHHPLPQESSTASHAATKESSFVARLAHVKFWWVTGAVQEHLSAVSSVVRDVGRDDEEDSGEVVVTEELREADSESNDDEVEARSDLHAHIERPEHGIDERKNGAIDYHIAEDDEKEGNGDECKKNEEEEKEEDDEEGSC